MAPAIIRRPLVERAGGSGWRTGGVKLALELPPIPGTLVHINRIGRLVFTGLLAVGLWAAGPGVMAGLSAPVGPVQGAVSVLPILTEAAPDRYEVAQRRSLFDILFGNRNPPPETAPAPAPKQVQRPPAAPASRPTPVVVEAVKNEGATRLAVIGDSLAVDLARALGRFYADDPDLEIVGMGVGSSGLVRNDFYDWETAISEAISADQFDLVVVIVGINDRQEILLSDGGRAAPLTEPWRQEYQRRLKRIFRQLQGAGKPAIWVGLPPMRAPAYSAAIAQISSIQRAASSAAGAEFVDIYERFVDEDGGFTANGPDLNGQAARMRKDDGIHFATAGSDKVAFFVDKAVRLFYRGGALSVAVADPLAGTDAQGLQRPPFQGLGQARLLEIAGAVLSLNEPSRAFGELAGAGGNTDGAIDLARMMAAPVGRADAFGVGIDPAADTGPEADLAAMQGPVLPESIVQALSIKALIEADFPPSGF